MWGKVKRNVKFVFRYQVEITLSKIIFDSEHSQLLILLCENLSARK